VGTGTILSEVTEMIGPIARKIGQEVAEELTKKAAPAAKKTVNTVKDKADDWGWDGHKASDLPPSEYLRKKRNAMRYWRETEDDFENENLKWGEVAPRVSEKWIDDMTEMRGNTSDENIDIIMDSFSFLQQKGMPRAWTGKYTKAFTMSKFDSPKSHPKAVEAFRTFDRGQRDTFLSLLPEWEGSLEDLIRAARTL